MDALAWFCEEGECGTLPVMRVWLAGWLGPFSFFSVSSSPCIVVVHETVTDEGSQQDLKGHAEHLSWSGGYGTTHPLSSWSSGFPLYLRKDSPVCLRAQWTLQCSSLWRVRSSMRHLYKGHGMGSGIQTITAPPLLSHSI